MALKLRRMKTAGTQTALTVVAVFALVAQPIYGFVAGQVAHAVGSVAEVRSEAELIAAAADTGVTVISVKASFSLTQKIVLAGRNVTVDGNGSVLTFAHRNGWNGDYIIQAYKNMVEVKNLTLTGGDAAVYANGATVRLAGTVNVSGNEFGGIEVSRGQGVTETPSLITNGAIVNTTEATGRPTVWVDKASTASAIITGGSFTKTTHIGTDQHQYYLAAVNANIAVLNTTQSQTYDSLNTAVVDAHPSDTLLLAKDIALSQMAMIDKPLTLDGAGKMVTANYSYTTNGIDNAVITVLSNGVTIKNLTTTNTASGQKPHGVVAQNVTGLTLNNLSLLNGRAGLIVNGSTVNVDTIRTSGNSWYGINVDKPGAVLTISGTNSHTDGINTPAIYVDNNMVGRVIDAAGQYAQVLSTGAGSLPRAYVLKTTAPVATLTAPTPGRDATITGSATTSRAIKSHWFEVTTPNDGIYYWTNFSASVTGSESFKLSDLKRNGAAITLVDGAYKIRYVATDVIGARSDTMSSLVKTVIIDTTKPSVSVTSPAVDGDYVRGTVAVGVTASDFNTLSAYCLKVQGYFNGSCAPGGYVSSPASGALPAVQLDTTTLQDGSRTLIARVVDGAGNDTEALRSVIVDNTKPARPVLTALPYTATNDFYFTWSDSSDSGAPVYYEFASSQSDSQDGSGVLNNGVWNSLQNGNSEQNNLTTPTIHSTGATGTWYWQVRAHDRAGNVSDWSAISKTTIDLVDPSVVSVTYSTLSPARDVTVTLTASEAIQTPSGWTPVGSAGMEFTKTYSANQTESVTITDLASRVSTVAAIVMVNNIDRDDPALTLSGTLQNGYYNSSVAYSVTDASSVAVTVDGQPAAVSGQLVSDGVHAITVLDAAGNSTTVSFTIDASVPVVTITAVTPNGDGTYRLTGAATDAGAGISSVLVTVNGVQYTVPVNEGLWTLSRTQILPADGRYMISVSGSDAAGNSGSSEDEQLFIPAIIATLITGPSTNNPITPVRPTPAVSASTLLGGAAASTATPSENDRDTGEVLGSSTKNSDTPLKQTAALTQSAEGWKLWGITWYWFLLGSATLLAAWWFIAGLRRRKDDEDDDTFFQRRNG